MYDIMHSYNVLLFECTTPNVRFFIARPQVCVAHDAAFTLYDWTLRQPLSLVARDDPALRFLFTVRVDGDEIAPVTTLALTSANEVSYMFVLIVPY